MATKEPTYATLENMRRHAGVPGVFAYSPFTGEESSANPADYWMMSSDGPLLDAEGDEMILARRVCTMQDVSEIGK